MLSPVSVCVFSSGIHVSSNSAKTDQRPTGASESLLCVSATPRGRRWMDACLVSFYCFFSACFKIALVGDRLFIVRKLDRRLPEEGLKPV